MLEPPRGWGVRSVRSIGEQQRLHPLPSEFASSIVPRRCRRRHGRRAVHHAQTFAMVRPESHHRMLRCSGAAATAVARAGGLTLTPLVVAIIEPIPPTEANPTISWGPSVRHRTFLEAALFAPPSSHRPPMRSESPVFARGQMSVFASPPLPTRRRFASRFVYSVLSLHYPRLGSTAILTTPAMSRVARYGLKQSRRDSRPPGSDPLALAIARLSPTGQEYGIRWPGQWCCLSIGGNDRGGSGASAAVGSRTTANHGSSRR
jgi:hypothetical protein